MNWTAFSLFLGGLGQLMTLVDYYPKDKEGRFMRSGSVRVKPSREKPELWIQWWMNKLGIVFTALAFWIQIILL